MAFLSAESLDFGHGKAIDAEFSQRFANFIQFKGLDDCGNEFHETSYPSSAAKSIRASAFALRCVTLPFTVGSGGS